MAVDRYSKDYRLVDSVDEKGRIHTETEYIGSDYVFRKGLSAARGAGKKLAVLNAVAWLSFLTALCFPSVSARALYAVLPCAFSTLPLWMLGTVAVTALRVKEPFAHREADRFSLRLPSAAVFAAVLSAAAVLGASLGLLLGENTPLPGDWFFLAGNVTAFICAMLCRKRCEDLAVRKL